MQKGFTLIEILFVILILAVAVIVIIPNLRKFSEDQEAASYADKLKQALRVAQSGASASIKCSGLPTSSWKIFLTSSQFNTVAVCKDPASETLQEETKATTTFLPSTGVIISDDNCKRTAENKLSVDADIIFTGSAVSFVCKEDNAILSNLSTPFTITLKNTRNQKEDQVKVDKGGLVY